jgi:hypothetical protein
MRIALLLPAAVLVLVACSDDESAVSSGGAGSGGATASSGTSTGSASSSGSGTSSSGATTGAGGASTGSTTGAGGAADCVPACGRGLTCCNGLCVNPGNDINHCGGCDKPCAGTSPFCDNGTCGTPSCDPSTSCGGTDTCCGSECCAPGMLCCVVPAGPVGPPQCVAPNENGTCDPGCPACECTSPETPVATPRGERRIADLALGDMVYSVDHGTVTAVPIVEVNRVRVEGHHVVRAVLATGGVVEISPRHPTADGRSFLDLRAGDLLGGVAVVEVATVAYPGPYTYDILPASDTGSYFAGGALVGSTLTRRPVMAPEGCFAVP